MTQKKILIVDDNAGFVRVLRNEIGTGGHKPVTAGNGVEALLRYLDGDIGIVLMDVSMPKMSGIDTLRLMRKIDPGSRFILFSGTATDRMKKEAMELGAETFLNKPFSIMELMDRIRTDPAAEMKENGI